MPIDVITGQPGDGKTLLMVQRLVAESEKTAEQGRRIIVACGIDGLVPGLADMYLADGRRWNEVDFTVAGDCDCHDGIGQVLDREGLPRKIRVGGALVDNPEWNFQLLEVKRPHAHVVPDGSLMFFDEAWKHFGHLHDASRAPTPAHVLALAEHRHRAIDMVWTTQLPNQLFPFIRGLVGTHTHVSRRFGTKITELFEWGEMCEDVKSQGMRDRALTRTWVYPKKLFSLYKSATAHTIKSKLPWRLVLIPGSIIVGALLLWWAYLMLQPSSMSSTLAGGDKADGGLPAAAAATESGNVSSHASEMPTPRTPEEWAVFLKPVVPGIAFTAPMFAEHLELNTYPQTLCIIAQQDQGDTCHCYTEQATPIAVADPVCRTIATKRYYDPFKPTPREGRSFASSSSSVAPARTDSSSVAATP